MDYLEGSTHWSDPAVVATYDELTLWSAMAGLLLLDHVPMRPGMSVLDVGPGTGFPLLELAQRLGPKSRVVGLDPWKAALARAGEKQRARGVRQAHLVIGDARSMPLASGRFHLVVSNLGLNNFDDPAASMAECRRVMAPGGTIAATTNLRGHMREFYAVFAATLREIGLSDELAALRRHVRHRVTVPRLRALFENAGLRVTRVIERSIAMRFADGSALLRHSFIRLGFLDAWKAVVPKGERVRVFERLESNLNQRAARRGELSLTIPLAYLEGVAARAIRLRVSPRRLRSAPASRSDGSSTTRAPAARRRSR